MNLEKRSGLLTQPYHMYILVNSGDLRIKLDLYYMRTCISFIMVNTTIKEANTTLQHETKMCLFPEVDVSHSVTRSIAILLNGLSSISVICKRVLLNLCFFMSAKYAVCNIFSNVFIHSFPIILPFY